MLLPKNSLLYIKGDGIIKNFIVNIGSLFKNIFLFLFGDFDFLIKAILVLMCLDYITGICKAFILKKTSSSIGAKGIIKKVAYLCIITVSVLLDHLLNADGGLRTLIIISFIFNEILSILENSNEIGIKVPKILYTPVKKIIKKIKNNDATNSKK